MSPGSQKNLRSGTSSLLNQFSVKRLLVDLMLSTPHPYLSLSKREFLFGVLVIVGLQSAP